TIRRTRGPSNREAVILRVLLVAVMVTAAAALAAAAHGGGRGFTAHVDNPWFPLEPGVRYTYAGVKDGQPSRDVVTVTHRVRSIGGVPCAVVRDRLYLREIGRASCRARE